MHLKIKPLKMWIIQKGEPANDTEKAEFDSDCQHNEVVISNKEALECLTKIRKFFRVKEPQMLKEVTKLETTLITLLNATFKTKILLRS